MIQFLIRIGVGWVDSGSELRVGARRIKGRKNQGKP
jgi:hypothetical protein